MTVTDGAYIAALSKKLMEAERALHGFRVIFNNFQSTSTQPRPEEHRILPKDAGGLKVLKESERTVFEEIEDECLE